MPLLHPDEALALIEAIDCQPSVETVGLEQALGRALAEEVTAPEDSPPFTKAAMDGYAVSAAEPGPTWRLTGMIAAGSAAPRPLAAGECVRIMTGAMLPGGADKVLRVEYTCEQDGVVTLLQEEPSANVIPRGQNLRRGERVLEPRVLAPQDIGVLASLGKAEVRVARRPVVSVLATGSELRNPGQPLAPGQIYDSNGLQMCAQVAAAGGVARYAGIVPDEPGKLRRAVERALSASGVVLLSGGVSMGELDFVPGVLKGCGAEILFHKLAIKPGKPTLFARRAGGGPGGKSGPESYVFGLPGNPVSSFVIFELFVKPLLHRLQGLRYRPRFVRARLAAPVERRETERVELHPARLEGGEIHPLVYHGSAHLNSLSQAEALLRLEIGVRRIEEGSWVDVRLL